MKKFIVITAGYSGVGETSYQALSNLAQNGGLSFNCDIKVFLYEVHEKSRVDLGQILTPKGEASPIKLCEFTLPVKIVRDYLKVMEILEDVMDEARFS